MEMLQKFEVMSDSVNADGVCAEKNNCESVLNNLTLEMTLRFVETSAAICRTTQHNVREELGLQKRSSSIIIVVVVVVVYICI